MVASIPGGLDEHGVLGPFERPDVGVDVATLDLVAGGGGAPEEAGGKGGHRLQSFAEAGGPGQRQRSEAQVPASGGAGEARARQPDPGRASLERAVQKHYSPG